jgi:hypothetical protein
MVTATKSKKPAPLHHHQPAQEEKGNGVGHQMGKVGVEKRGEKNATQPDQVTWNDPQGV